MATGFELLAGAKSADALVAFDAARSLITNIRSVSWGRSLALASLGRHDEAADEYARLLSFAPTDCVVWQYVAQGWVERGRNTEAEACFTEARAWCRTNAERFEAYLREALFWAGCAPTVSAMKNLRGGTARADTTADRLTQLSPDRLLRAETAFTHAIALDTDGEYNSRADAHRSRGMLRYHLGRLNGALADADEALERLPGDATVHLLRALVAMRRCDWPVALAHLDTASRCGLPSVLLAEHRCWVWGNSGEIAKGEEAAREWRRLDPTRVDAHTRHGELLRLLGKDDEADRAAERAAELAKRSVPWAFSQQAYTLLGQFNDAESADRTFARLLDRPGLSRWEYLAVFTARAQVRFHRGHREQAFDDLTQAVRLAPDDLDYRSVRVKMAVFLYREQAAFEDAEALRRLRPNDPEAWKYLQQVRGPEELRAAMAGRAPDYRPAGPLAKVPLTVSAPRTLVAHLAELYERHGITPPR